MIKNVVVLITAAAAVFFGTCAFAADKMPATGGIVDRNQAAFAQTNAAGEKEVGYCSVCKIYYSLSDTKKMRMMDSEGHKLVITPFSKVPKSAHLGHMGMKQPAKKKR